MKYIIVNCFLFIVFAIPCLAQDAAYFSRHFKLLPQPQKVELFDEKGLFYTGVQRISLVNTTEKPVLTGLLSSLPLTDVPAAGTVSLVIEHGIALPSPEGYILEIRHKQITIKAAEKAGLFYGIQTLEQLLEDSHDQQIPVPACKITDYPKIAYRAVHLDLKHHVDAGHYYYHIIDQLAGIKINAIIIEFEDKLRYRKSPLVGAADAISIEEFAAISRYAKERNIEISPLVQGLGHASFILKHDAYKTLRDDPASDWVFDPLNPQTYELQFSLYEDAMLATPYGKYLHVGGDEVGALGKSALAQKSGMKPIELQLYWLKKVTGFAKEHHRIPIFWDDMVFKLAGLYETTYDPAVGEQKTKESWKKNQQILDEEIALFPRDCVYMRWNYDDATLLGNQMAIDWYKSKGLVVMGATAAQQVWPMIPRNQSNFEAIKGYCRLTTEKDMNGILCTAWDDCSPHFETVWRGIYDFALLSWNYRNIGVEAAHETFRHRFYRDALAPAAYEFEDSLENAMPSWETAFLEEGDRYNYHKEFKLIDLPDDHNPGVWSRKYPGKINRAEKAIRQYTIIKDRIQKSTQLARRNQYALSVMNQVNELQVYPARQLLLLEQYDTAVSGNRASALTRIKQHVSDFQKLRSDFENVYSETRIMGNPEGYLPDSNFHEHLANGTNNTDWMFVYELAMNKKISQWK